jgi:hypothetical protein
MEAMRRRARHRARRAVGRSSGLGVATTLALAVAACGAIAGAGACGGGASVQTPVPSLASNPLSGVEFEAIRESFRSTDVLPLEMLRERIQLFLLRWPDDGLVPLAHVYMALVLLGLGELKLADVQLALGEGLPPGNTRDLWTVASAQRLRLGGNAEGALQMLRPLVGKNVDPITRAMFEQELTLAALATHRDYEAISYMDAWLRASESEDQERTRRMVTALVEKLPKETLLGSLQSMRVQRASFGYGVEIERILSRRLVQIATTSGDAELARLLLDEDAGALLVRGDAAAALGELATSRRGMNVVEGRTLGLLLPTELPALRDESADVLRGVMWALGLPRGVRGSATAPPARPDAGTPGHAPCAQLEAAPPLDEPGPDENVRLVTRDDAGQVDRTEGALDELAGEGAALVVAGLDAVTASRALQWGQAHGVAVIAIVPPDAPKAAGDFSFVLGESRARVVEELTRALPALGSSAVVPVVDQSEVTSYPAQGGRVGDLALLPPVSCDIPAVRAGDPRFPIGQWEHDHVRNWLVTGEPGCARDVLGELSASHVRGMVALTLEAAGLPPHATSLREASASAGVVPSAGASDERDDELRRFVDRLGPVGWWTALGRDAGTLARAVLRQLPVATATEVKDVTDRRAKARDLLAGAHARLWSTEASGWQAPAAGAPPAHVMGRTVCAVEAPAR